jgi:hypothetical protein
VDDRLPMDGRIFALGEPGAFQSGDCILGVISDDALYVVLTTCRDMIKTANVYSAYLCSKCKLVMEYSQ